MKNLLLKTLFLLYCFCCPYLINIEAQEFKDKFKTHGNAYSVTDEGVLFSKNNSEWVMLDSVDMKSFRKLDGYYNRMFAFDKYGTFFHGERVVKDTAGFKSYECLEYPFCLLWRTNKGVYWGSAKLENIDLETFEYLGELYYKDKNAVYCGLSKVEGADPNTFLVVNKSYGVDSLHIFRQENMLIVDGQNPQFVDQTTYKTYNAVYWSGKYFTNPRDNPPLENFDAKTLRRFAPPIIDKNNNKIYYCPYIQDDDYIFLYGDRYLKLPEDTSTIKMYHFKNDFVLHIAPDKYRLSNDRYDEADILENPIIVDNSLVGITSGIILLERGLYIKGLSGVIPFEYSYPLHIEDFWYANSMMIYKDQAYHVQEKKMIDLTKKQLKAIKKNQKLTYIDGEIFETVSYMFKKNNKSVYNIYNGKLEGISPKKFEAIDYYTFKNKQGVFYLKKNDNAKGKDKKYDIIRIKEADNKSFKSLKQLSSHRYTYDKNSLFSEDERLPLVRSKNLRFITQMERTSDSLIFILVSNVDGYWLIGPKSFKPYRAATSEYVGKTFPYKLLNME